MSLDVGEGLRSIVVDDNVGFTSTATIQRDVENGNIVSSPQIRTTTQSYTSLQELYHIYHPLDRMILTANGNVQRLISSYYDTKDYTVQVNVLHCHMRRSLSSLSNTNNTTDTPPSNNSIDTNIVAPQVWDRKVELYLLLNSNRNKSITTNSTLGDNDTNNNSHNHNTTKHVFCIATSIITIYDMQYQQLIATQQIGIGQLFRYYNILPNFTLHNAGPLLLPLSQHPTATKAFGSGGGGNFWREYTLSCPQLSCWIREEFPPGLWNISLFDS